MWLQLATRSAIAINCCGACAGLREYEPTTGRFAFADPFLVRRLPPPPKKPHRLVKISPHVAIYEDDPRFDALQNAYRDAKKDWLQNWNIESRIWQSAC